jgi:hypothetical protein
MINVPGKYSVKKNELPVTMRTLWNFARAAAR